MIRKFLAVIGILLGNIPAFSQENSPPILPWHLADVWWTFPKDFEGFESIKVDFEVIGSIDQSVNLYIAPVGLGCLNGDKFYGGIQTHTGGMKSKDNPIHVNHGSGGIFSRWSSDGNPISLDYAKGDNNTYYDSAGYEGEFVGVRTEFSWAEGKYTFIIKREEKVEQEQAYWFGAYLVDKSNGSTYYYGSLKFRGDSFVLSRTVAAFYEVYGPRSKIPKVAVIFEDPIVNDHPIVAYLVQVNYPDNGLKRDKKIRYSIAEGGFRKTLLATVPTGIVDDVTSERF